MELIKKKREVICLSFKGDWLSKQIINTYNQLKESLWRSNYMQKYLWFNVNQKGRVEE